MQSLTCRKNTLLALGALALLGGSVALAPAQAQDAGAAAATPEPTKPITLDLRNVNIQIALQTLFTSAGIKNYRINSDVQGFANINVSDVPFSLALRQLLLSVNPPLTSTVDNGIYVVSVAAPVAPPTPTIVPTVVAQNPAGDDTGAATDANAPKRFYRIPIDKYDAYYIATLLGRTGIVQVGVNDVIPAGGQGGGGGFGQGQGQGQGQGGFGQGQGGFGQGGLSAPVTSIGGNGGNQFGGGNTGGFGGGGSRFGGGGGGGYGGGGGFRSY